MADKPWISIMTMTRMKIMLVKMMWWWWGRWGGWCDDADDDDVNHDVDDNLTSLCMSVAPHEVNRFLVCRLRYGDPHRLWVKIMKPSRGWDKGIAITDWSLSHTQLRVPTRISSTQVRKYANTQQKTATEKCHIEFKTSLASEHCFHCFALAGNKRFVDLSWYCKNYGRYWGTAIALLPGG